MATNNNNNNNSDANRREATNASAFEWSIAVAIADEVETEFDMTWAPLSDCISLPRIDYPSHKIPLCQIQIIVNLLIVSNIEN